MIEMMQLQNERAQKHDGQQNANPSPLARARNRLRVK
jgi:hypothetical protein